MISSWTLGAIALRNCAKTRSRSSIDWFANCPTELLAENRFEEWLSAKAGTEVIKPAPEDVLQMWPVSMRVNSSRADDADATLIEKVAA